jgi:putative RecB family exonuclease
MSTVAVMTNQPEAALTDGTPVAVVGPRPLSPSRAADFKSCPLKYRFRTIDRLPEPPSAAAARGTLVHAALQQMFGEPAPGRSADSVTAALPQLWSDMVDRRPELAELPEAADLGAWFDAARGLLHTYFGMEDPTRFEPEACELLVETTLAGEVPARGIIDRLDVSPTGLIRIVDYKTGRSPAAAFADHALFQLKFYALMLLRLHGVVVARLRLIYLGDGQFLEYTPDLAGLQAFENSVAALWRAISDATGSGNFPAKRSRLCDWCAFKPYCPEFGGTPPPYPPHTTADLAVADACVPTDLLDTDDSVTAELAAAVGPDAGD